MSLVLEIDIWAQIVQLSGPSASSLSCPHWCFLGPRPRPLGQETLHWHQETKTGEEEREGSSQDPWLLWKRYLTLKVRDLASLVAQLVKNLPAMQETQETRVWSMGWEDPLEESMVTHSSILAGKNPMDRGAWQATVHGCFFNPLPKGYTSSDFTSMLPYQESFLSPTEWVSSNVLPSSMCYDL